MAGIEQFNRGNVWGFIRNLLNNFIGFYTFSGTPTSGTSGSFAGKAGIGSFIFDITSGALYVNQGTRTSPTWTPFGASPAGLGGLGAVNVAKMTYDFTVDGGAISVITPSNSPTIPLNAIIYGGVIDTTVAATSGGAATIALGLGAGAQAALLKGATGFATFGLGVNVTLLPVFTSATYFKVTAAARMTLSIAAATLTAGKISVTIFWTQGNA